MERVALSVVIPHWPLDDEVDAALQRCVTSLPRDSEKIVVVNEGTRFAVNVSGAFWVIPRDVFERVGPLDERSRERSTKTTIICSGYARLGSRRDRSRRCACGAAGSG